LPEGEGEPFSSNGIDGTGAVPDKGYATASDTRQATRKGDATPFRGKGLGAVKHATQ
jgi:hypothetical protein